MSDLYTHVSFNVFRQACADCWKDEYGFLIIDKDSKLNEGRYRKWFDVFMSL